MTRSRFFDRAKAIMCKDSPDEALAAGLLEEALRKGDKRAAYALATWYLHGRHYKKSRSRAVELLCVAAEANVPDALFDLAICYEKGAGVDKDEKHAVILYLKAAFSFSKSHPRQVHMYSFREAAFEVGRCYYHGIGVEQDREVADVWMSYMDQKILPKEQNLNSAKTRKRAPKF
jgi:uncharacterized protein